MQIWIAIKASFAHFQDFLKCKFEMQFKRALHNFEIQVEHASLIAILKCKTEIHVESQFWNANLECNLKCKFGSFATFWKAILKCKFRMQFEMQFWALSKLFEMQFWNVILKCYVGRLANFLKCNFEMQFWNEI